MQKFEVEDEVVPDSFIEWFVNGEKVAVIRNLYYNRYYPAISTYNFAVCEVNFGLRNLRILGYPQDFYGMNDCIVNVLEDPIPEQAVFGFQKLDI